MWCQEEPGNQGAWYRIQHYLRDTCVPGQTAVSTPARPSSASPAVGYLALHNEQQKELVEAALRPIRRQAASAGSRSKTMTS